MPFECPIFSGTGCTRQGDRLFVAAEAPGGPARIRALGSLLAHPRKPHNFMRQEEPNYLTPQIHVIEGTLEQAGADS